MSVTSGVEDKTSPGLFSSSEMLSVESRVVEVPSVGLVITTYLKRKKIY